MPLCLTLAQQGEVALHRAKAVSVKDTDKVGGVGHEEVDMQAMFTQQITGT